MGTSITGIDIWTDRLAAVQVVRTGFTGYEITACAQVPLKAGDIGEGLKRLSDAMELKAQKCFVSIPSSHVSFRTLEMPFKESKQIRQTLPYELETILPYSVETLVVDFMASGPGSSGDILSASIEKEVVARYLETLNAHGVDPDALGISGLAIVPWFLEQEGGFQHFILLALEGPSVTLFLCENRHVALIRSFTLKGSIDEAGFSEGMAEEQTGLPELKADEAFLKALCSRIQHTIHAYASDRGHGFEPDQIYLTGRTVAFAETETFIRDALGVPAEWIDVRQDKRIKTVRASLCDWVPGVMNGALASAISNPHHEPNVDFRRDEFGKRQRYAGIRKGVKKGAFFLVSILILLSADFITDAYFLKKTNERLDARLVDMFKQTLPRVTRIVDPVQQLRVAVDQLERSSTPSFSGESDQAMLNLIRDISQRIPATLNVHVSRMTIDPETVRLSGKTNTFNSVDSLKSKLAPSAFFSQITISSANMDKKDNRVKFELKLKRKR